MTSALDSRTPSWAASTPAAACRPLSVASVNHQPREYHRIPKIALHHSIIFNHPKLSHIVTMPLPDGPIPTYRIDVALPPEQRYVEVARDFAPRMRDVTNVFDELLLSIFRYRLLCRAARFCAKALFRRLYDDEQNREVRSISKIAGVDLYLVIALNILLDALMSCTAGCILTEPRRSADGVKGSRLMHFRTLDWGMHPLRELLIVVEFVDSRQDPDLVIATSVTYAGFVGTLTAARQAPLTTKDEHTLTRHD